MSSEDWQKASEELRQLYEEHRQKRIEDSNSFWDSLSQDQRELAFYAVVSKIFEAEITRKGSYRHALYDVFDFDSGMYADGMDCGYMAIHNAIGDGEDYNAMKQVERIEVIDDTGRAYVKYLNKKDFAEFESIRYSLQDDSKTLKIFIGKGIDF